MRRIFYNEVQENTFREKGYVIIPFFDAEDIAQAKQIFKQFVKAGEVPFYLSIWDNDIPSRNEVHRALQSLISEKANQVLADYKFLINCFAVKSNIPGNSWHAHQDDSFTDESRFESLSIWIPLLDVDSSNGAMSVLEKSHEIFLQPRSPTLPKPDYGQEEELKKRMKVLNLRAGEAVIFSHRLVHSSGENLTQLARVAVVSVLIPREAPVWFYFRRDNIVDVIELNEEYYLKFALGSRPEGEHATVISRYDIPDLSKLVL